MKYPTILLFLLLFTACEKDINIPKPDPATDVSYADHPRNSEYQSALEAYRKATSSPGALMLIHRVGEPLWAGAVGNSNLEHQTPMRTNTPFRCGSFTKVFVATLALQLVEAGQLSLDDPLDDLLPKAKKWLPKTDEITLQHLLAHLSGIYDPTNESNRYRLDLVNDPERIDGMSTDQLMEEYVQDEPLHFEPGTGYAYSNVNYWLLAQIIEQATGKSLQAALEERLFGPLELANTYLEQRDDRNVARGYSDVYGDGHLLDVTRWESAEVDGSAAGGMVTTATDVHRFLLSLMEGEILSPANLELMKQVQLASCNDASCEYGLGLELWRTGAGIGFGHNGSTAGTETNAVFYPESGNLFVIFKNNGNGSDKRFLDEWMQ